MPAVADSSGATADDSALPAAFAAGKKPVVGNASEDDKALPAAFAKGVPKINFSGKAPSAEELQKQAEALQRAQTQMELQNLAALSHMQNAQMQMWAQDDEMQRMQVAMQMQMAAAEELQSREDTMKRMRGDSPLRDFPSKKRRPGEKDTTEYYYDVETADRREKEEGGVGTNELVKKVKIIKRSSPRGYSAWESYCMAKGSKTKDPRLHNDDFLQGFFDAIGKGDFGEIPGAVAILGADNAKKFTPPTPAPSDPGERPHHKAVFIAGLPKHTSEQGLLDHFSKFGSIQAVRLKFDTDGNFRGVGEVEFWEESSAKKVLDNFDYNLFEGRWVNCMVAKRKGLLGRNPKWWTGTNQK